MVADDLAMQDAWASAAMVLIIQDYSSFSIRKINSLAHG